MTEPTTQAGLALLGYLRGDEAGLPLIGVQRGDAIAAIERQAAETALRSAVERVRALPGEYPRDDDGHPMGMGGLGEENMRRAALVILEGSRS